MLLGSIDRIEGLFGTFMSVGILVGALLLAIPIIMILRMLTKPMMMRSAEKAAIASRGQEANVRVRQTDIESNMTRKDRKLHQDAELLIRQGKILDAANILESIKFQRKAIDLLEHHNMIDEAAAILLRLNVPQRAAVVYERNKMHEQAAHFYAMANMHDKAGKSFMQLAHEDYRYYFKAIEAFTAANYSEGLLQANARLLQTQPVVEGCLETGKFDFLFDYMRDPASAAKAFVYMNDSQIETFLSHLDLSPQSVRTFTNWVWAYPKANMTAAVMRKVHANADMCQFFWQSASAEVKLEGFKILEAQSPYWDKPVVAHHCRAIKATGHAEKAHHFLKLAGAFQELAASYVQSGLLSECQTLLAEIGETVIARELSQLLTQNPTQPWSKDVLTQAYQLVEGVTTSAAHQITPLSAKPPTEASVASSAQAPKGKAS